MIKTRFLFSYLLLNIFCVIQFMLQGSLGLMAEKLRPELGLDAAKISILSASFFYSYLLMQIPAGLIYDRYGLRKTASSSIFLAAMSLFLMSQAYSFLSFLICRILLGIFSAFALLGLLKLIRIFFAKRYFTSLTLFSESFSMFGVFVLNIIFSMFMLNYSWQVSLQSLAFFLLVLSLLVFFTLREEPHFYQKNSLRLSFLQLRKIMSDKRIWLFTLIGALIYSLISAFLAVWAIPFFRVAYHMTNVEATSYASIVYLGLAVSCPLIAFLSRKFKLLSLMLVGSLLSCLLTSLIIFWHGLSSFLLATVLFFLGASLATYQLSFPLVNSLSSQKRQATAMGLVNMVMISFSALLQPLFGILLSASVGGVFEQFEHYSVGAYRKVFLILPFLQLLAFLLAFYASRKNYQHEER